MPSDRGPGADGVEDRIMAYMRRELLDPEVALRRDDELLAGGLLDSMGVLRLATFLEEEFRFKMEPSDFVIENFQTVAILAAYVRRAAGHPARPPGGSPR